MRVFEKRYYQDRILILAYGKWWVGYTYTHNYEITINIHDKPDEVLNTDHKIIKGITDGEIMHLGEYPFPSHWREHSYHTTISVNNPKQADAFIEFFESFQKKHLRPSKQDFQTLSTQLKLLSADYG